ncbi:HEAT repeat domain-containing protein [Roseimicrobium sp. ORNL1]|uniref:HEAT repeat domain-containing protein n=1 Tax=Roseimicrobium sp. ORNL1 TaxID=2711231 RepID=UPI0013E0F179|nr:HEAT repeat domain-containing protein [Roseimicrobium sp. ORNL1]QIF02812.1 HEAT repeat domain-containing protein [Roseimicrobium sp. ORNL1]
MSTQPTRHAFIQQRARVAIRSVCVSVCVCACVILGCLTSASALPGLGAESSVEWLTCKSEVVAVGRLQSVTTVNGPGDVVYEDTILAVSEMFKGPPVRELKFSHRHFRQEKQPWIEAKGEVLVFLATEDAGGEKHMEGVLSPVNYFYCHPFPIFDLGQLPKFCVDKDLNMIMDPQKILSLARTWGSSKITHCVELEVPFDSSLGREMGYQRHQPTIEVPAEEKYRAKYVEMAGSENPSYRAEAVYNLLKCPGPETERILRDLLKDESTTIQSGSEADVAEVSFYVRQAAFRGLVSLGVQVAEPPLKRRPTAEESRNHRTQFWGSQFRMYMRGGWKVESVEDGASLQLDGEASTSVVVTCSKDGRRCCFTLVPRKWGKEQLPNGEDLGTTSLESARGRQFILTGTLSKKEKANFKEQFGLYATPR